MKRNLTVLLVTGAALLFPLLVQGGQDQPAAKVPVPEELTRDKIFAAGPEWQQKYDSFQPAQDMLDAVKSKLGPDDNIVIYLGLWCPDSRNHVPTFLKMLDKLGTNIPVRFFGVPRKANRDVKYYYEELQVEKVPTFIFYHNGKELGRIVERPKAGIVEDTLEILYK